MGTTDDFRVDVRFGESMSTKVLEQEICARAANLTAAECEWLLLLAEFDRRRGWAEWNCRSCARWLAWQVGLDLYTAYDKVRVAHALVAFPIFADAMSTGALSYAKVRSISRIANDDNAAELLETALSMSSNQLDRVVAACRASEAGAEEAEARAFRERSVSWRREGASAVVTVRLPVEAAAEFYTAMDEFMDLTDLDTPEVARRADAASAMAEIAVVAKRMAIEPTLEPRYLATVHLTPDVFDDEDCDSPTQASPSPSAGRNVCCVSPGDGLRIDPSSVPVTTARRILCDAVIEGFRTTADGEVVVGSSRRTVPRRLKRALLLRDGGCRFPGCGLRAWVDAHHIQHWMAHGPTRPQNLVCLCRQHHRLMHEGGWNIAGDPSGELFFHRPDGSVLPAQPIRVVGNARLVDAHRRAASDGRCGWTRFRFDYDEIAQMIVGTERARRRSRACRDDAMASAEPGVAERPRAARVSP